MDFRTIVPIPCSDKVIEHNTDILLLGSCFAENIGEKLSKHKFNADINPFGILYNPLSIEKSLNRLINQSLIKENELFFHENCWHSFDYHSSFSNFSKEDALKKMNERLLKSANKLKEIDLLLITFGTAWIYEEKETGTVVSNCHKLPANSFIRRRISVEEIVETYTLLLHKLQTINKNLQVLFTVSPIRHWKDGAHENTLSKATLHLVIEQLQKQFDFVNYFPAYELIMDDLRDYRFYANDMLHPNQTAIDYIWERFGETYFTMQTKQFVAETEQLNRAMMHRPFNADADAYKQFCQQQIQKIENLKKIYPTTDFTTEETFFKNKL
jgi:lysophospholipase L1-like esterase